MFLSGRDGSGVAAAQRGLSPGRVSAGTHGSSPRRPPPSPRRPVELTEASEIALTAAMAAETHDRYGQFAESCQQALSAALSVTLQQTYDRELQRVMSDLRETLDKLPWLNGNPMTFKDTLKEEKARTWQALHDARTCDGLALQASHANLDNMDRSFAMEKNMLMEQIRLLEEHMHLGKANQKDIVSKLEMELQKGNTLVKELENCNKQHTIRIVELERALQSAHADKDQRGNLEQRYKQHISDLEHRLDETLTSLGDERSGQRASIARIEELEYELRKCQEDYKSHSNRHTERVSELERTLSEATALRAKHESKIADLASLLRATEEMHQRQHAEHLTRILELQEQCKSAEQAAESSVNQRNQQLLDEIAKAEEARAVVSYGQRQHILALERQLEESSRIQPGSADEGMKYRARIGELERRCDEIQAEKDSTARNSSMYRQRCIELEAELARVHNTYRIRISTLEHIVSAAGLDEAYAHRWKSQ